MSTGESIDFEKYGPCHRTIVTYFLNKGKWYDFKLEDILKTSVVQIIYREAMRFGKPVFCIMDDTITISSKTKSSSRTLHPIEDTYFHQSHLKGKQDYNTRQRGLPRYDGSGFQGAKKCHIEAMSQAFGVG